MLTNDKGLLIVLEGGEGAGKSTIIQYLARALSNKGISNMVLREPGGTNFAEDIRNVFFKYTDLSPEVSVHLMNAQRKDNIEKIITPSLNQNDVVIIDRFTASTLIYQGVMNNQYEMIRPIMVDHVAYNIFVDVRPEIGLKRIEQNKRETNHFDRMTIDKHQKIYQGFKSLSQKEPENYWDMIINGEQTLKELYNEMNKLAELISNEMPINTIKFKEKHGQTQRSQ